MTIREILLLVFAVLGGLALFIFGMNVMTEGLRQAAGNRLRRILARATRRRSAGLGLGTTLGALVHSSAATVMLVGFVNAGLMTLEQTVPVMLGANVGTTLSMQAISFRLGDYAYAAIAVGLLISLASPRPTVRDVGRALLGFGLLFLGMNTMSGAIAPHREALAPILAHAHGETWRGLFAGIAVSAALTAIWQSSGATIGICFALISAGVFTDFLQVYPIVLGAHIGTCATGLLGSIGAGIEARRTAVSHLVFNVANTLLGVAAMRFFLWLIPLTSGDLIRQTANLHTAVMLSAAVIVLPFSRAYTRLVRALTPSRQPPAEPSFLDESLLAYPEQAIAAVVRELQRVARICTRSLRVDAQLLVQFDRRKAQQVKLNERIVNEIKAASRDMLFRMTRHYLSRRQAILIQHLNRCVNDIERIGDHIDAICDVATQQHRTPAAALDGDTLRRLIDLHAAAEQVLRLVIRSLDPEQPSFQKTAESVLNARDAYMEQSLQAKHQFMDKLVAKTVTPIGSFYFSEYVAALDRIVRHAKTIALAQKQPDFWIKRKKLDQPVKDPIRVPPPDPVDVRDFLDRLQKEDYL